MTSTPASEVTSDSRAIPPDISEERPSGRAWYALAVLVLAMLLAFIDREILVLLAQLIKKDLSLSDFQIGETQGLFPALFTIVSMVPLAWLADRFERRTVLCGCILLWSVATAASGLAIDFRTLLVCTIAIVIGEAALSPIVYSLIPDLFPVRYRPRANIIAYGASALGGGLGLALGGALIGVAASLRPFLPASLQAVETWRLTFFLVALPGPLVAIAVFLIGATQRQVVQSKGRTSATQIRAYVKKHGAVALGAFGTMGLFSLALLAVSTWVPVALIRTFHVDAAKAGINYGLTFMAGAAVGLIIGHFLTPYWRRVADTAFVLRAISCAAAATAVPVLLYAVATSAWQVYILHFCFSAIFITGVSLMPGMMQDVAPPAIRARVIAAGTVLFIVVGRIGPPLVGFISDQSAGNPRGLIWAIVVVGVAGLLGCAALARFMENPYRRTVAALADDTEDTGR